MKFKITKGTIVRTIMIAIVVINIILKKFGVDIIVNEDEIIIPKTAIKTPTENLNCHNDHRIAMSLAIMCSRVGGTLVAAQCVNKSYPEFFDDIKTLGIQHDVI